MIRNTELRLRMRWNSSIFGEISVEIRLLSDEGTEYLKPPLGAVNIRIIAVGGHR